MSLKSALRWRLAVFSDWLKTPPDTVWSAGQADIIFISADANKTDDGRGFLVDRVLDPLREKFEDAGYRCLTVARPGSKRLGQGSLFFVHSLNKRAFLEQLIRSLNVLLAKTKILPLSSADLDGSAVFERLMKSTQCKAILALNTSTGLCQAGFRSRIPVVEVLHARGYATAYTEEWASQKRLDLPAGIVAYDAESARAFGTLLPTLRIPNYRFDFEMMLSKVSSETRVAPIGVVSPTGTKRILFTASWDPTRPEWPAGPPPELLELIRLNSKYFLMVRIHPGMMSGAQFSPAIALMKNQLRQIQNADIEWSSSAPLYSVLQHTDVHITWNSLSTYEAADLGIQSFVLEIGHSLLDSAMKDLVSRNYVHPINSEVKQLKKAIDEAERLAPLQKDEGEVDPKALFDFACMAEEQKRSAVYRG